MLKMTFSAAAFIHTRWFVRWNWLYMKISWITHASFRPMTPALRASQVSLQDWYTRASVFWLYLHVFVPHVALSRLVGHQQVTVHLIHQLRSDPSYRHILLIWRHVVIVLWGGRGGVRHPGDSIVFEDLGFLLVQILKVKWVLENDSLQHQSNTFDRVHGLYNRPCTWGGKAHNLQSSLRH